MGAIGKVIGKVFGIKAPKPPEPLPKLPMREDPEIEAARKRRLQAAKLRKGRGATILTGGRGLADERLGTTGSPQARAARLLGE